MIDLAIAVVGKVDFFQIIHIAGVSRLSQTCKTYRYTQRSRKKLLGGIIGSTNANLHLRSRLCLFGMMPRAMVHSTPASRHLINTARDYERNLVANRRFIFPEFYAYAYYNGICGSSDAASRRRVWREIAAILCEMLENGESIGVDFWNNRCFLKRRNNARHYQLG
jgi:hypothetical protein